MSEAKSLEFIVNGNKFTSDGQYIQGSKLRAHAQVPADHEIFLDIEAPWEDEEILDHDNVNLARPGIESFYTKGRGLTFILIINGTPKEWNKRRISFPQVVKLALGAFNNNPQICYTVKYECGPSKNPKGMMVDGDKVFLISNMIFHVSLTDKS